jgi:hypothetical protein
VNALPVAVITPSGSVSLTCSQPSVQLTADGGATYLWSNGMTSASITLSSGGPYTVTVTDANACSATASQSITVNQTPPTVGIIPGGSTTICAGNTLSLQVSPAAAAYAWSNGSNTQQIQVAGGTYSVTVTGSNGCTAVSTPITVTEESLISSQAGADQSACGNTFTMSANSPGSLSGSWSVISGPAIVSNPGSATSSIVFTTPGTALLRWTISSAVCGTSSSDDVVLTQLSTPTSGTIAGTTSSCIPVASGSAVFAFSNNNVSESYSWTVPVGMNIVSGAGTQQITAAWTAAAASNGITGQVCVTAANACSSSAAICTTLHYQSSVPVTPGSISGAAKLCPGNTASFSVSTVARASAYDWTLPGGVSLSSGSGTNIISAVVATGYAGGNVTVRASNACGFSGVRSKALGMNIPLSPGIISGPVNGLCSATSVSYSTAGTAAAAKYQWTLPSGASISGSDSGATVLVNFGNSSGTLSVRGVNACGTGNARSVTVNVLPARPSGISGSLTPCTDQTYTYGTSTVNSATQYGWTVPSGASIAGTPPYSKDIQVTYGSVPAGNQLVTVTAANACGSSPVRSLSGIQLTTCSLRESFLSETLKAEVYPSPTSGRFYLLLKPEAEQQIEIALFDITGQQLFAEMRNMERGEQVFTYDLSEKVGGVYLLRIRTGDTVQTLRVIVQH